MANIIDRIVGYVSPRAGLQRARARMAETMLARHYEGASSGRRTQDWNRSNSDANAAANHGTGLSGLRGAAQDLVRNNGLAESAVNIITDHAVGTGIVAKPRKTNKRAAEVWKSWAETTECDSDGRCDMYGLQKLVWRTVVISGECLIRRRMRTPADELSIPMQLQVIEPDLLDTSKTSLLGSNGSGGRIIQGVEFDPIGRRRGYWLFSEHPGSVVSSSSSSYFVPAESVLHVFKQGRPGQVRGVSWFAPVLLTFKDYDKLADATLMKQLVAACLAIVTTDVNGEGASLGATTTTDPLTDMLEPGMVLNAPAGRDIKVINPPTVNEYSEFEKSTLRRIATGLGVNYEDLTGDYGMMPFSAARLSRLRHWARVDDWRWRTLIPQFCDPVWAWAMRAASVMGLQDAPEADWTPPPAPMIDPQNEGLAYARNIRAGIQSLSEVLRERGFDPRAVLDEIAADNKVLDELEIILDSDPRNTTQSGGPRYFQVPELTDEQITAAALDNAKKKKEAKNPPPPAAPAQPVPPQIPARPQPAK
jgi:lambda family phage portal protein